MTKYRDPSTRPSREDRDKADEDGGEEKVGEGEDEDTTAAEADADADGEKETEVIDGGGSDDAEAENLNEGPVKSTPATSCGAAKLNPILPT